MAHKALNRRKFSLLTSTALTGQAAALGALSVVFGASSAFALDPNALPQDPNVVGGAASFNQSGATLTVNQATNRTVIDWRSFDIGSNATTTFVQPGTSSIAVNRVNSSANPTQIQGSLNANGQVWILNPNGVLFGKTAKIDVAGIVASTGNINTDAFMRGDNRLQFTGSDGGEVVNDGLISVADGGLAAFVAPSVRNSGVIRARVGKVTLAAGTTFTLDLAGDQLVELGLGANNAVVNQDGQVLADGSVVNITAKAASAVVDSVINVSGAILASSAYEDGGTIVLTADNITTTADAVLKADAGTNGNGGTIYGYADKLGKYDGTFSAQGGSQSGNGGFIETSGKKVQIANGISVNTLAANGATGNWTIDPVDLTVIAGDWETFDSDASTVSNGTIVRMMETSGITLTAENSITIAAEIDSSSQTNSATLALNNEGDDNNLTINLNNKITLGANQHLTGQGTTVNVSSNGLIQNGVDVAAIDGATVNVAAGSYTGGIKINKNDLKLSGAKGAKIDVISGPSTSSILPGQVGIAIDANNVTVEGFEIAGDVIGDQTSVDWSANAAGNSWGVWVTGRTNTGVTVRDNNIHDVRTGILVANSGGEAADDATSTFAASGTIADNLIENTKGGILVQYRDGHTFDIYGNKQGTNGNEWGIVTGLQLTKINSDAGTDRQAQILGWSENNNNMTVLDRQYATANRSSVIVDATSTASAADDYNLDNGLGNERQPLKTIQSGINAVVTGGTVNVNNGTYVIPAGGDAYVHITKSLNLIGHGAGTIIDATNAWSYGIRVQADNVTLSDFTLLGSSATDSYGIKVEPLAGAAPIDPNLRVKNFNIKNVDITGSTKTGLDLNGVVLATIDNVRVKNTTSGNGIALTDSAYVTITNSVTTDNAWGGLALYQNNGTYNQQVDYITVAVNNTFNEMNPVYLQDESSSQDFGTNSNIAGFDFAVSNQNGRTEHDGAQFTWLQKTAQQAVDFALGSGGMINTASSYIQGWSGSAKTNTFTVGTNGANAMSINTAINAALNDATIDVLPGAYTEGAAGVNELGGAGGQNFGLFIYKDGVTLRGVDANGQLITDPNSVLATITAAYQTGFGAQHFVSGNNVTIEGLGFRPAATGDNKTLEVVGDNFTLQNSVIDNRGNATSANIYIDDMELGGGRPLVERFNIQNNIFYGGNTAGAIVVVAAGVGRNTDESQRIFDGNKIVGNGIANQRGFQVQGVIPSQAWQQLAAGPVTVTNNTFSNVDIPVRSVGELTQNLEWDAIFRSNGNVFGTGAVMVYEGDTTDARAGTASGTSEYKIFTKLPAALTFNGIQAGDTVRALAGTYNLASALIIDKSIKLVGDGQARTFIDGSGLTGRIVDLRADDTTLTGFTINGDGGGVGVSISGQDATVTDNTINNTLTGVQTTTAHLVGSNATISGNTIRTGVGISLQNANNIVSGNNVTASMEGAGLLSGANTFTGNIFDISASGTALALHGSASASDLIASSNTVSINGGGLQGAVDLTGAGGNLNVLGGTYTEDVVINGARNISFAGATLNKFTTNVATAIGGTVSTVNGFFLNAATTLLSNTVLNGSVTATSIDGSTAGGQTLTVNGGNNALGSLGATTRLGATSISGTTKLNGSTYAANALSFAGPVTLTQSQTTFNTTVSPSAAGNITFTGNIYGTTDGAQNVAFIAGSGKGATGANGDISLQNAGTDALWLGSMNATGDDFSGATVYVGGSYNSTLTGNQTFTTDTLHTRGSVTSNVGGDATGPIVSGGNVNVVAGGNFNGNVTAPTGTIQGQTITGAFTGNAFTFVASKSVDVDVNANTINVTAPAGTVDGTFTTISTGGGSLVVNGQTRTGNNNANPNQIVVEGYTLPAGALVTPSGEIILPSGMVIGLISPQAGLGIEGGKPKVIIVHSVQRLGELLAQGYVAIIVDLSKNSDETEEIALAN